MKYPTIFHLISAIFKKANVSCILIGGFAINYYKVTRQTVDVDFLITEEDVEKILHLIALKLHSIKYNPKLREPKDLPDIINLIRVNNVNVKNNEFKELCLKYGTEELYNKILIYF